VAQMVRTRINQARGSLMGVRVEPEVAPAQVAPLKLPQDLVVADLSISESPLQVPDGSLQAALCLQRYFRRALAMRTLRLEKGLGVLQVMATLKIGDTTYGPRRLVLHCGEQQEGQVCDSLGIGQLRFNWTFHHQRCVNMNPEQLFGMLCLSDVKVTVGTASQAQLDLEVKTGTWSQKTVTIKLEGLQLTQTPSTVAWPEFMLEERVRIHSDAETNEHWFNIWHFCSTPLIRIESDDKKRLVAFFCLPRASVSEEHPLKLSKQLGHMEAGTSSSRPLHQIRGKDLLQNEIHISVRYTWELFTPEMTWPLLDGKLEIADVTSLQAVPRLRILVQCTVPGVDSKQIVMVHHVSKTGKVNSEDRIGRAYVKAISAYGHKAAGKWTAVAKRAQYLSWDTKKLTKKVASRETPLNKCWGYSAMLTRKQRYAILQSAILSTAWITLILFVDCDDPENMDKRTCKLSMTEFWFSWDALFASMWAPVLSVPVPVFLITIWRKITINAKVNEATKNRIIKFWTFNDVAGWCFVVLLHSFCIWQLSHFVAHYGWNTLQNWAVVNILSIANRLVIAPGLRIVYALLFMTSSYCMPWLDVLLARMPAITTFDEEVTPVDLAVSSEEKAREQALADAPADKVPVLHDNDSDPQNDEGAEPQQV